MTASTPATDIRSMHRHFNFRFRSTAHWIEVFRSFYGPIDKTCAALPPERQAALTRELSALLGRLNVGGPDSLVVPGQYLEVVFSPAISPRSRLTLTSTRW